MKRYNIVVNGTAYAVEVEEVGAGSAPAQNVAPVAAQPAAAAPAPAPVQSAPTPAPAAPSAPAAAPSAGAQVIDSPMPGTILDIKVKPGDVVAEGQVLVILEAMKMENEIMSPGAGTVDTIQVTKGAAVNAGDVLLSLK